MASSAGAEGSAAAAASAPIVGLAATAESTGPASTGCVPVRCEPRHPARVHETATTAAAKAPDRCIALGEDRENHQAHLEHFVEGADLGEARLGRPRLQA